MIVLDESHRCKHGKVGAKVGTRLRERRPATPLTENAASGLSRVQDAISYEIQQRSGDLKDGSVRGLSIEEARRIVASEPADDDR